MLKSRDLFIVSFVCVFGVFFVASNFADRFITRLPEDPKIVSKDLDLDFQLIAAAQASVVRPRDGKFDLGRIATRKEIAAWDRDISPDELVYQLVQVMPLTERKYFLSDVPFAMATLLKD